LTKTIRFCISLSLTFYF